MTASRVARVHTVAFSGIEVIDVDVQAQISPGMPAFNIVGLGDKAVAESKERIRAAFHSVGLSLPPKRITVNLAPADVQKEGSHFDLPIAIALLVVLGSVSAEDVDPFTVLGELSLDGGITAISGVLSAAIGASGQGRGLICPASCGSEAAWAGEDFDVLGVPDLLALVNHFKGVQSLPPPEPRVAEEIPAILDMADIRGQETARRAVEIAAAGGHNLLMVGPPGSGKSMLAARLPGLLPELSAEEALELSMIHSVAGHLTDGHLLRQRPFRDPHHSASLPALVGGGMKARPGEVSLSHHGVLFLDELPEFSRQTLEALRQPIETRHVTISRANSHVTYPANFQLVAAMNPCKCGHLDDAELACSRAPKCAVDYQAKISGPLFDRIDIHVDVPAVSPADMSTRQAGEPTKTIAKRVNQARAQQRTRFEKMDKALFCNAQADGEVLAQIAPLDTECHALLREAAEKMKLSARGWNRVIRVARTIADLAGNDNIERQHVAEALSYRRVVPR